MKHSKKILSFAVSMFILAGMNTPVLAEEEGDQQQSSETYSITVKNENSAISLIGKTFTAYKLFDVLYSGTNYAYSISTDSPFYSNEDAKAVLDLYFDFDDIASDEGTKTVTVKTEKLDQETNTLSAGDVRSLADGLQPYISGTGAGSVTADSETAVISLTEPGYYIVTGTVKPTDPENSTNEIISAVILNNADPDAEVHPKASVPTLSKKITCVKEGAVSSENALLDTNGLAATAEIGSVVSFELNSAVPDLTGYTSYTFTINDTLSEGLTYADHFKVTINGTEEEIQPAVNGQTITVTIPFSTLQKYAKGDPVAVTYDASVNENALSGSFENNTAVLTYSHSPYDDSTNDTPSKTVYITDIDLDVLKIDGSDSSKKLSDAEFKFYRTVNGTDQYYHWDTENSQITWVASRADGDTFVTDTAGNLTQTIRGIDQGTYYLLETKAPVGYNLLKEAVEITVTASESDNQITYSAAFKGESAAMTGNVIDLSAERSDSQPKATGTIENNSGIILPDTGGIGTVVFYLTGAVLIAGAAVIAAAKKQMKSQ